MRILVVLLVLALAHSASAQPRRVPDVHDMDAMDAVPEWLRLYVRNAVPAEGLTLWIPGGAFDASALVRVPRFPGDEIEAWPADSVLTLRGVRNEQVSAQLAVIGTEALNGLRVLVSDLQSGGAAIPAERVQVRYVGYVPVVRAHSELTWSARFEEVADAAVSGLRTPDVVADPLVALPRVDVPALRAQPVWFTFEIPEDAAPGTYAGRLLLAADGHSPMSWPLELHVAEPALPDPLDFAFHLDVWMNPAAVAAWHGVPLWSSAHWQHLEAYLRDLAAHSQKKITTTIVENPWPIRWLDGQMRAQTFTPYASMVRWTRRKDGTWHFDFSVFDRYVETALRAGVGPYIGLYSMLVFRGPQRFVYFDEARGEVVTEVAEIGTDRWREVWNVFLPQLRDHLRDKGWLDRAFLAFDERPPELMREISGLVVQAAPELADRILLAGTAEGDPYADDLSLAYSTFADGRSDRAHTLDVIERRRAEGQATHFYTAGTPAHPNTFAFSPAVEARMLPWVALQHGLDGYLRWSYNDWPPDVFRHPSFFYIQGDEYLVYPGEDGPVSSIRWELLKEGIEDVELARVLREAGRLDDAALQRAIGLATQSPDGREKDPYDLIRARLLLLDH